MRTEQRTIYIADNGKEFESEDGAKQEDVKNALLIRFNAECFYRGIDAEDVIAWIVDNYKLEPK